MQDEDVHILSFITALNFLSLFLQMQICKNQKWRIAAPSSFARVIYVADFIL